MTTEPNYPSWWRDAIAIEYLPCRNYREGERIGRIDFGLVPDDAWTQALTTHRIVSYGTLFHNVDPDTFRSRTLHNLFSPVAVPLADGDSEAIMPHGQVGQHHFPILTNSIHVADPIESFNSHIQVLDEGVLYQWKVARFEGVEGRHYGRWVSEYTDLSGFDALYDPFQELMSLRRTASPDDYVIRAEAFVTLIRETRASAFAELLNVHEELKKQSGRSKRKLVEHAPPVLSHFEMTAVDDNKITTRAMMAPVFYRSAVRHCGYDNSIRQPGTPVSVRLLDEMYGARAEAVIMAMACLEAVANEIGYKHHPNLWDGMEKLSIDDKFRLIFRLCDQESAFDTSKAPWQALGSLIKARNGMIHFKPSYKAVSVDKGVSVTSLSRLLGDELASNLPTALRGMIEALYLAYGLTAPPWLQEQPGWSLAPRPA
ncbi:hypothetical protein [Burkholderia cepacia]|uniref:hypothetical protein n=1 Tax=Burkholderia cepacia TaxID=292 RepID=UPI002018D112|nr:hypothetical protein [Burkholderia cepacia]UQO35521.1 hypothetical protein L0Z22_07225 [Burkholderia cepacia]UQO45833.1 hypothetical protein L0Z05_09025 [Burkholderia cepacia]UQP10917.1 hypothetical protein L0Z01_22775 [Burkholderia cepacia]